jgi:crotonobetainyl-CoA:carnitine CoA-transferase CaiB-like acyl-CoA transferase
MMAAGERGAPPSQILPGIGDEIGGLMCAWGVSAALYSREKTGRGQVVDTSLMGSIIGMLAFILAAPAILGQEFPREIRAKAGNPLYNHYRCKDDKWIVIAHLDPDRYWKKICKAVGIEELQNSSKFTSIEGRGKNAEELVAILDDRFVTKTREEWMRVLNDAGCIFTPIQSPLEVVSDPQAFANNYVIDVQHPSWGKIKMSGFPWDFSMTPAAWRREAPGLGQHTEEVLREAGYTDDDIEMLRAEGAIE